MEAPKPTYHSETYAYLSTRRTQPTCREENTWNRGPMGDYLMKWCIHNPCKSRDKAQGPRWSDQPDGQLTSSTPELRAHLNRTNNHKKKSHHTCKHVLIPGNQCWVKGEAQYCGPLFNISTGETRKMANCFTSVSELLDWNFEFRDQVEGSREKGEAQYSGPLFNKSTGDRWDPKNGQLFHFT